MNTPNGKITIRKVPTNKANIDQPEASKRGILPTLPASFLLVGKSGSGKSTVLYNLLTNKDLLKDYFNYVFVFSPVKTDDILKKLRLPKDCYIDNFDEDKVASIIYNIEKKIEKGGGLGKCGNETRILFVFDDILSEQKLLRSNTMKKLATANRHFNISMIVNSQYYKAIPPVIRTNVSAIIIFPSCLGEIEKLADENAEPNQSKNGFISLVQEATKGPYDFFYINKRAKVGQRLRKGFDIIL